MREEREPSREDKTEMGGYLKRKIESEKREDWQFGSRSAGSFCLLMS